MSWIPALANLHQQNSAYALLTVLHTQGSIPRDTGSKMLVTQDETFDTIGGGALEFESINMARELLNTYRTATQHTHHFNLGKDLKQCCGGVVEVFFEVFPAASFNLVVFGAGHIGEALMGILQGVDCHVKWFDSRPEIFPETCAPHIQKLTMTQPDLAVESCQAGSFYVVMTHDHSLDQQLCEAILSRDDSHYCGLIGSHTKGLKFRQRLIKKGFNKQELDKLICPVGLSKIKTKKPMEIAVSIAAELLQKRDVSNHQQSLQKSSDIIELNARESHK